jgi:predicted phage-related endonuclease
MKLEFEHLEVALEDMDKLTQEEFAMARRDGIGASDMSAILGAMDKFKTADDVLREKLLTIYTDEEKAIGEKVNVRKGRDLEPMILDKARDILEEVILKPTSMYRMTAHPYLTINFDGVIPRGRIPVEAKFCSTYADKYYDFGPDTNERWKTHANYTDFYDQAKHYGVPAYYYIQLQQQLLGANAPYGYLAVLRDKDWNVYIFKIMADDHLQQKIINEGYLFWNKRTRLKNS